MKMHIMPNAYLQEILYLFVVYSIADSLKLNYIKTVKFTRHNADSTHCIFSYFSLHNYKALTHKFKSMVCAS